jgi:hypothetical protein
MLRDLVSNKEGIVTNAISRLQYHRGSPDLCLEFCKRLDRRYKDIRDRHYIPNAGSCGQQIHFLIHYNNEIVGIMSGGSAAYATRNRDEFFRITKTIRDNALNGIINNTVFRLEENESNLATRCLSMWRSIVSHLWETLYEVEVFGFETFVVETDSRKGTLYKADNWEFTGETSGSTKSHLGVGLTGGASQRKKIEPKLIFCKWHKDHRKPLDDGYVSSWRCESPEEKARARRLQKFRQSCLGQKFCAVKNTVLLVR